MELLKPKYSIKSTPNALKYNIVLLFPKLIVIFLSPINYGIVYKIRLEGLNFTIIKFESYYTVISPLSINSTNS